MAVSSLPMGWDGLAGIGTISPSNMLEVIGNADVMGYLGVGISAPTAQLQVGDSGDGSVAESTKELKARADKAEYDAAQLKAFLCGQFPNAPMCHP